jgi:hypothetical protein
MGISLEEGLLCSMVGHNPCDARFIPLSRDHLITL